MSFAQYLLCFVEFLYAPFFHFRPFPISNPRVESGRWSTRLENLNLAVASNLNVLKLALLTSSDSSLRRRGNDLLDAHDVPPRAQPVAQDIRQDEHEPDERHDVADTSAGRVGDGALDWREDGST